MVWTPCDGNGCALGPWNSLVCTNPHRRLFSKPLATPRVTETSNSISLSERTFRVLRNVIVKAKLVWPLDMQWKRTYGAVQVYLHALRPLLPWYLLLIMLGGPQSWSFRGGEKPYTNRESNLSCPDRSQWLYWLSYSILLCFISLLNSAFTIWTPLHNRPH